MRKGYAFLKLMAVLMAFMLCVSVSAFAETGKYTPEHTLMGMLVQKLAEMYGGDQNAVTMQVNLNVCFNAENGDVQYIQKVLLPWLSDLHAIVAAGGQNPNGMDVLLKELAFELYASIDTDNAGERYTMRVGISDGMDNVPLYSITCGSVDGDQIGTLKLQSGETLPVVVNMEDLRYMEGFDQMFVDVCYGLQEDMNELSDVIVACEGFEAP